MQQLMRFLFSNAITSAVIYAGILAVVFFLVVNVAQTLGQQEIEEAVYAPDEKNVFSPYDIKKHPVEYGESINVLVLHSLPTTNNSDYSANLDNINNLVQILQSHWNLKVEVQDYAEFDVASAAAFERIIFIELNDSPQATNFFKSVMARTSIPVMWIGCGTTAAVPPKYIDQDPPRIIPHGEVSAVTYKDIVFDVTKNFSICKPISPRNAESLTVLSTYTTADGQLRPLVTMTEEEHILVPHNVPFLYSISNYSLPFLDTFHHFLSHHTEHGKTALLRLEDVNVFTYNNPRTLRQVYDYLNVNNIPFHIAFIEYYRNPLEGIEMHADASLRFLNLIKEMVRSGDGVIVQHGYTHQVKDEISGIGFEFWDAINDAPLLFPSEIDAYRYTLTKINDVQTAMERVGLPVPDIWETPHYAHSVTDNEVFSYRYPLRYEHIQDVGSLPFFVKISSTVFVPENLGYITDEIGQMREKRRLLEQLGTFEDPVASVFWHPWRDINELKQLTSVLLDEGYQFVSVYDHVEQKPSAAATPITIGRTAVQLQDTAITVIFLSFVVGVFVHARNVYRVRKFYGMVRSYDISLSEVIQTARAHKVALPTIALFIPARNEGLVIGNTLRRIANLDYPKNKVRVYVIADEREHDDDVVEKTIDVARETAAALHQKHGYAFISILEVPKWYSGIYGDTSRTYEKSTKGRALNYCLQNVAVNDVDVIGILDADGRLHNNILKEVAMKRIIHGSKILQGPVFQVNNFKHVSIIGIAAGLELALHHLTELPYRLNKKNAVQFLAGTNYFIETKSIQSSGGWNQHALVEDAELALRIYVKDRTVGEWLNSPELEQTPANFAVYRKQRERWVRGHIDLIAQIRKSNLPLREKLHFYNKIFLSQFRFIFDIGLPILAIYLMVSGLYIYMHPVFWYLSIVLFICSIFIWDTYGFVYRTISDQIDPQMTFMNKVIQSIKMVLFLPVFVIAQAVPRVEALYNFTVHPKKSVWYKTERTAETITH